MRLGTASAAQAAAAAERDVCHVDNGTDNAMFPALCTGLYCSQPENNSGGAQGLGSELVIALWPRLPTGYGLVAFLLCYFQLCGFPNGYGPAAFQMVIALRPSHPLVMVLVVVILTGCGPAAFSLVIALWPSYPLVMVLGPSHWLWYCDLFTGYSPVAVSPTGYVPAAFSLVVVLRPFHWL